MKASLLAKLAGTLLATGSLVLARDGTPAAPVDWSGARRVEIRMIEYEIVPDQLRFTRALPYQLHIINAGKEGHDFTAPDFFGSVELRDAGMLDERRGSLQPQEAVDIYFVAPSQGLFAPRCADHDWAGMTATIVID
jgi:hypothetical protein